MTMTDERRTDVHRPSSPDFDPEAYACYGVFDTHVDAVWDRKARNEAVNRLVARGFRSGAGSSGQCGHCGTPIRYAALMVREDVQEYIFVGETCLEGRFDALTAPEFQRLRETARLNKERATKNERTAALVADHPILVWLTYMDTRPDTFLGDMREAFEKGRMTDRQIEAAEKAIVRQTERNDQIAARAAAGIVAPEGRVTVEGEIVAVKETDGYRGPVWKMTVKADAGWRVWVTVPESVWSSYEVVKAARYHGVYGNHALMGQRVRFTATLERSRNDGSLAYGKRPTKTEVVTDEATLARLTGETP